MPLQVVVAGRWATLRTMSDTLQRFFARTLRSVTTIRGHTIPRDRARGPNVGWRETTESLSMDPPRREFHRDRATKAPCHTEGAEERSKPKAFPTPRGGAEAGQEAPTRASAESVVLSSRCPRRSRGGTRPFPSQAGTRSDQCGPDPRWSPSRWFLGPARRNHEPRVWLPAAQAPRGLARRCYAGAAACD